MTDDLLELGDRLIERAEPGEELEVVLSRSQSTEVRAHEGEVESLTDAQTAGVGVRVIRDGRMGFASVGSLDPELVDDALDQARDNARFASPDDDLALVTPDGVEQPDLDLLDPTLSSFPTDRKVELAIELERRVRDADPRIVGLDAADYGDEIGEAAIVSTSGVRARAVDGGCSLVAYALASDTDETTTGFGWSVGRGPAAVDPSTAAQESADRAIRMLGARKPQSEHTTVILTPMVTAQFLDILASTFSGEAVLKGRSLFADRLGESVAADAITLIDDPTDQRAFTASEIDGEGLACRRNVLIDQGVASQFVHNAWSARKMGTTSTANAVRSFASTPSVGCHAVRLVPGTSSLEELMAKVGNGIVVHEVIGLHSGVNPVSGDFSTGAEGRRLVDGELGEPLREFTIAATLQRMLTHVVGVGDDLEWLPMSAAGVSLAIDDVAVSGV